jgi:LuxR family transcriptional regulator, maltose regulon positive regulatory protein
VRLPTGTSAPADLSRDGIVPRTRLTRQLAAAAAPIGLIVAPAGFGKTTLVADWSMRDEREFLWLSLPVDGDANAVTGAVERAARSSVAQVIVVDDLQGTAPSVMKRLLDGACRLPRGSTLVLISRTRPACAFGRLRARRLLFELEAADLALSRLEAAMVVDAAGLRLDRHRLERLLDRTGGWPAMVNLATMALAAGPDVDAATLAFGGADRVVAEFLRDEVLGPLTPAERTFLRHTAVLAELTPAACDAVLDAHGSGAVLMHLPRAGVPLEPLDRTDAAFRLNPLLAQMLRSELALTAPEQERRLHRRAASWYARERDPASAIRHAMACRDVRLAGRIAWAHAPRAAANGRGAQIGAWLEPIRGFGATEDAGLGLTTAVHLLMSDSRRAAEAAIDAAERRLEHDPLPAGATAVALLRACMDPAHPDGASTARAALSPDSPWQALALLLQGVASHLDGDRETARAHLDDAAARAGSQLLVVSAAAHAQLVVLATEAEDWDEAASRAREARLAIPATAPNLLRAFVAATSAVVAAQRGDIAQARHDTAEADRLLTTHEDFPLWLACETHVWLARAAIRLSEGPTARRLLARAARLVPAVGHGDVLTHWIHDGWDRADAFAESATGGGPTLTNAELRILRLLPSHMSFREIGERLHVSSNTVKTQALAVYRKLDVTCRSDAVQRGLDAGLIGDT